MSKSVSSTSPKPVDLCLDPSWIIPLNQQPSGNRERILSDCSLIINDGLIEAILPRAEVALRYSPKERLALDGQLIMPGLINCHGHAAMTLMRGVGDDQPLQHWLEKTIWPLEARHLSEEFVGDGSRLAMAEMLLSGTTCFADMYFYPGSVAAEARKAGMRAQLYFPILQFETPWAQDEDSYLHKGLQVWDDYRSDALINVGFGPHAPYSVSKPMLQRIATYAEELQASVQIHLQETAREVEQHIAQHGCRPIDTLAELGLLSPLTQCVHMTQVVDTDIELLVASGAQVIHCPQSNMKLASGACPTQKLLDAGINVALGTDGAASNNELNLFAELQAAALLGKLTANDAAAINAFTALEMATISGAKAMGLGDVIGSLEAGKAADLISVDLTDISSQPLHNIVSQLVYTQSAHRVRNVWVAGQQLVKNRQLTRIDSSELRVTATSWQRRIRGTH